MDDHDYDNPSRHGDASGDDPSEKVPSLNNTQTETNIHDSGLETKHREITEACTRGDTVRLASLSSTEGGFLSDHLRSKVCEYHTNKRILRCNS